MTLRGIATVHRPHIALEHRSQISSPSRPQLDRWISAPLCLWSWGQKDAGVLVCACTCVFFTYPHACPFTGQSPFWLRHSPPSRVRCTRAPKALGAWRWQARVVLGQFATRPCSNDPGCVLCAGNKTEHDRHECCCSWSLRPPGTMVVFVAARVRTAAVRATKDQYGSHQKCALLPETRVFDRLTLSGAGRSKTGPRSFHLH